MINTIINFVLMNIQNGISTVESTLQETVKAGNAVLGNVETIVQAIANGLLH